MTSLATIYDLILAVKKNWSKLGKLGKLVFSGITLSIDNSIQSSWHTFNKGCQIVPRDAIPGLLEHFKQLFLGVAATVFAHNIEILP